MSIKEVKTSLKQIGLLTKCFDKVMIHGCRDVPKDYKSLFNLI